MTKLVNIQHLRAIAALTVLVSHLVSVTWKQAGWTPPGFNLDGRFGVDVFFVISGFIMFHTSAAAFGRRGASGEFAWRRLARIVPLYWLCTLVEAALLWHARSDQASGQLTVGEVVRSLLFIPYFNGEGRMRPVLGVGWSLDFEMLFYAVFAAALLLPLRRGLAAIALAFAVLVGVGQAGGQSAGAPEVLRTWTSPILLEFLIGVGLGVAFAAVRGRWTAPGLPVIPIVCALILAEASWLFFGPSRGADLGWRPVYWLLAAAVVATALAGRQSEGLSPGSRTLLLLGEASYAIYLIHPIGIALLVKAMSVAHVRGGLWLALLPLGFALSVAAGVAVHLWVERPITRRLRWRGPDHRAGLAPASP